MKGVLVDEDRTDVVAGQFSRIDTPLVDHSVESRAVQRQVVRRCSTTLPKVIFELLLEMRWRDGRERKRDERERERDISTALSTLSRAHLRRTLGAIAPLFLVFLFALISFLCSLLKSHSNEEVNSNVNEGNRRSSTRQGDAIFREETAKEMSGSPIERWTFSNDDGYERVTEGK